MSKFNLQKYGLSVLVCALCVAPLIATAAIRQGAPDVRTISVPIADLNLSKSTDVATLFRRLQRAADKVCGSRTLISAGSLKQRQLNQRCYSESLSSAVREIGIAELDELHARSKRLP